MSKSNKGSKYWAVKSIVNDRFLDGKIEYLLSWEGFDELHNSWESEKDMKCNDLVQSYLKEKSEKGVNKE